jgi:hypothetical protein
MFPEAHDEAKEPLQDLKKRLDRGPDFPQSAHSDRSTKITYLLAGAILSAILTRIVIRLRQRAGRALLISSFSSDMGGTLITRSSYSMQFKSF